MATPTRLKHAARNSHSNSRKVPIQNAVVASIAFVALFTALMLAWYSHSSGNGGIRDYLPHLPYPGGSADHNGPGAATAAPEEPVEETDPPIGFVDFVIPLGGQAVVSGWTLDWDDEHHPLTVRVFVDGEEVATAVADGMRADISEHIWTNGHHGFDVTLELSAGDHEVCVYAVNYPSGSDAHLGCESVTIGDD